jgi:C1A family cysteine protease
MLFKLIIALTTVTLSFGRFHSSDENIIKKMFEDYISTYKKEYKTLGDKEYRMRVFVNNLKEIDNRNDAEIKNGKAPVHGITKFSDLTQEEFRSKYLTADVTMKKSNKPSVTISTPPSDTAGLVDWTGVYTTPVKDQGYCGSCWAFSATEQLESDSMRTLGTSYLLSPEQITQCASLAYGCGGGWTEVAYGYVSTAGGISQDSDYPYTSYNGVTGVCSADSSDFVIGIGSGGFTTINGESSMASYVQSTGPLSVCLDANNWNSYTGGVMSVCGQSVDHCVQAVGVDTSGSDPYWKVRNSWGTSWGESGFIRLAYGQNTCDITNDPTYVDTVAV